MKLSNTTLRSLKRKEGLFVPQYDRSEVTCGIMHMSIGGFHRSHQAVYVNHLLSQGENKWGICAVGLMPQDKESIDKLNQQNSLYTVLERSKEVDIARIVGSITEVMHAPSAPQSILERLNNEEIKILSLTITEKGYCYDNSKNLDQKNVFIQHDINNLGSPKTALGYIVSGLQQRKESSKQPFTVMSCDNLPNNGHITKKLVLQFSDLIDKNLSTWINDHVSFPNSMVDRITPAAVDSTKDTLQSNFSIEDNWPVVCEDYIQWILEDNFCNGRPPLEEVGVQIVSDVEAYEKMKVRLLNGSHSALSYISYLMGYREVDIAMSDPLISQFIRSYMDVDITPTLPDVPGIDLDGYKDKLIERFSNPAISDQIQRLAEDGSQKIPNAIAPCILYQFENDNSYKYIALALAGWFRYLMGQDEQGKEIIINDPLSEKLTQAASVKNVKELLSIKEIFGPNIVKNEDFVTTVQNTINLINDKGIKAAMQSILGS